MSLENSDLKEDGGTMTRGEFGSIGKRVKASGSLDESHFKVVSRTMDELLYAAEGIQQLAQAMYTIENECDTRNNVDCLVESMGKYVQKLRNQAAQDLDPIYKCFGVEPVSY